MISARSGERTFRPVTLLVGYATPGKMLFACPRYLLFGLVLLIGAGHIAPRAATRHIATRDELRVLFIGNSLTYTNDLPGMIGKLAAASGQKRFTHKSVAFPDHGLEDHWRRGEARKEIAKKKWDIVVLQQGPSASAEGRESLKKYTRLFASEIRAAGARVAVYMVWPSVGRFGDFERVSESHALAAKDVGAVLLPVGEAWRAAWRLDPQLALYSPDGFHPSEVGTFLAALVFFDKFYARPPAGLSSRLKGSTPIKMSPRVAELLQAAAAETNERFTE